MKKETEKKVETLPRINQRVGGISFSQKHFHIFVLVLIVFIKKLALQDTRTLRYSLSYSGNRSDPRLKLRGWMSGHKMLTRNYALVVGLIEILNLIYFKQLKVNCFKN